MEHIQNLENILKNVMFIVECYIEERTLFSVTENPLKPHYQTPVKMKDLLTLICYTYLRNSIYTYLTAQI